MESNITRFFPLIRFLVLIFVTLLVWLARNTSDVFAIMIMAVGSTCLSICWYLHKDSPIRDWEWKSGLSIAYVGTGIMGYTSSSYVVLFVLLGTISYSLLVSRIRPIDSMK